MKIFCKIYHIYAPYIHTYVYVTYFGTESGFLASFRLRTPSDRHFRSSCRALSEPNRVGPSHFHRRCSIFEVAPFVDAAFEHFGVTDEAS